MKALSRGILIACEGIDGSGKSTLVKNVVEALKKLNLSVIATREPGATPLGAVVRTLIQEKKIAMCPKAEYLLFASDRAQHFHELVLPRLHEKYIVVSDRMADSSLVYQGFGRGTSLEAIRYINQWSMNNVQPDITLYVKIDPVMARERIVKRNEALTAYEKEKEAFIARLVDGFETIFADRSDVIRLDGARTPEQLTDDAVQAIIAWLQAQEIMQ
jgi:dTMP kinase